MQGQIVGMVAHSMTSVKLKFTIYLTCLILLNNFLIPYVTARWDPYEIVGVSRDANLEQIKKAYRESARKLHPDKSNTSVKKFIELNKAFDILKDNFKRHRHDRDEYNRFYERIIGRLVDYYDRVIYLLLSSVTLQIMLAMFTCALITILFMYKGPKRCYSKFFVPACQAGENSKVNGFTSNDTSENRPNLSLRSIENLKLLELKAETYNGMIRLLKPGHRTIVVITDIESKGTLLSQFKRAVWPYRRNRTLLFGFLDIDKNLDWYRSLLMEVLDLEDLVVNKKRCIGTVLSLNGFKRYFRVYHFRHNEIENVSDSNSLDDSFLDFNEDDPESGILVETTRRDIVTSPGVDDCSVDNLLDKLPIWLERMFDGMTKRYFLDSWPEDIK